MDYAALGEQLAEAAPMPFTVVPAPVEGLAAHVDGDYCAYFCAGSDTTNPGEARRNMLSRLDKLKFVSGATKVVVHLSSPMCTKGDRFHVATEQKYQGQRKTGRKPVNYQHLMDWMLEYNGPAYTTKVWETREADDGMAYLSHVMADLKGQLQVIHTCDKDMRMFCGKHVIWKTYQTVEVPLGTYEIVGPDEKVYGHKWFWLQMLMGDTADHIPGLRNVGEGTAMALLKGTTCNEEAAPLVFGKYREHHDTDWADRFVEQASLLWMRVDKNADLADFMRLGVFGDAIRAAVERMRVRVEERKQFVRSLAA